MVSVSPPSAAARQSVRQAASGPGYAGSVPATVAGSEPAHPDPDAAWDTLCRAASLGGDTDTIAAMAGAVLGATGAAAWPRSAVETVRRVNGLELERLVDGLLQLRRRHG